MAEFPALPLFTDAYLGDTRHLTTAQHGAYLLLLMTCWRTPDCTLPNDDKLLSRWAGMSMRNWQKTKPVVMGFWQQDEAGRFTQNRLQRERQYVTTRRDQNVQAGRISALKYKERHSTSVTTQGQHKDNQPTPTPTPSNITTTNVVVSAARQKAATTAPVELIDFNGLNEEAIPPRATVKLSPEFTLATDWGQYGLALGRPREYVSVEARKFAAYFTVGKGGGKRRTIKGWRQSWNTWIGREPKQ